MNKALNFILPTTEPVIYPGVIKNTKAAQVNIKPVSPAFMQ